MVDFLNREVVVHDLEELHQLYILFTDQQNERYKQQGLPCDGRVPFMKWCITRKICPKSIITSNSNYWLDTISICDGEGSLTLPMGLMDTPDVFFQALSIVRKERFEAIEAKRGGSQNSN